VSTSAGSAAGRTRRSNPGATPDLVVSDPSYRGKISAETHQMNLDYNSFEGFDIQGRPHTVTVRGKVAARDGKFVGDIGHGKFLAREPNHF
jgi:dihydropyrimidinase